MLHGLSHMTFIVVDLDCSERLLVERLGARRIYESGEATFSLSPERFYLLGEAQAPLWIAIIRGPGLPELSYNHVAFKIDEAEI